MPERIQLSRKRGWRMPENTVVVSRPSKWGNPHDWREYRENYPFTASEGVQARDAWAKRMAIDAFAEDMRDHHKPGYFEELRGKNLACWCKPGEPCHADVLLELANPNPGGE